MGGRGNTPVGDRIARARAEHRELRKGLLGAAWATFALAFGALWAFVAYRDAILGSAGVGILLPAAVIGVVAGKSFIRLVVAGVLRSVRRELGLGTPRERTAFLVAAVRHTGTDLRVMLDDLVTDGLLVGYFAWQAFTSDGWVAILAWICAVGFGFNVVSAMVHITLSRMLQAHVLAQGARPPLLTLATSAISHAAFPLAVFGAMWLLSPAVAVRALDTAALMGVISWTAFWFLLPIGTTLLVRRAVDRTVDHLNAIEDDLDRNGDTQRAESGLRALRLGGGQLIAQARNLEALLSAYARATRAGVERGPQAAGPPRIILALAAVSAVITLSIVAVGYGTMWVELPEASDTPSNDVLPEEPRAQLRIQLTNISYLRRIGELECFLGDERAAVGGDDACEFANFSVGERTLFELRTHATGFADPIFAGGDQFTLRANETRQFAPKAPFLSRPDGIPLLDASRMGPPGSPWTLTVHVMSGESEAHNVTLECGWAGGKSNSSVRVGRDLQVGTALACELPPEPFFGELTWYLITDGYLSEFGSTRFTDYGRCALDLHRLHNATRCMFG